MIGPAKYKFPRGMRPSTVREREEFYRAEFSIERMRKWFRGWKSPIVFAVVLGRHTRIFPREYRRDWKKTIVIDEYENFDEVGSDLTEFRPEAAYYDRNIYQSWDQARYFNGMPNGLGEEFGQQLALDIDPENFDCPIHGTLEDKMSRHQGLSFCRLEFQLAALQTSELIEKLAGSFEELRVVYSGRGFHIHIFDENTFYWSRKRRKRMVGSLTRRGYRLDEWVVTGSMRLIRLPYSLNGLVSRTAIPLTTGEVETFDPTTDERCIPNFSAIRS
jgi:DNA primase catalytic subunit